MKLKKLAAALNPFHAKRAELDPPTLAGAAHPHSFSCPCVMCEEETQRRTLARLKEQSPRA